VTRSLALLIAAAAVYGFAIGASNSWTYALRNVVKFPLLVLATAVVCALCYFVVARFVGAPLGFVAVQRAVLAVFRDTTVLLASLSPAVLWLARTMQRPDAAGRDLGDYPLFQGFNVAAIAVCGCLAVWLQAVRLLARGDVGPGKRRALLASWMGVSLLVGGQVAWYLRPFFGINGPDAPLPPWFLGDEPDFRGARSFYEACANLVVPPEGWR
jgi:hypothetical protein